MKVSMVSVSRRAGPPQVGQVVARKLSVSGSGLLPSGRVLTSMGSSTGRSASATGTMPHFSQ